MKKKSQLAVINDLQSNPNYLILNNPLSALKFVRKLGLKTEQTLTEVYTPKLFYEIISRLTPEHLDGVSKQQNILLRINIKDFLKEVDTAKSRNLYSHILDCVDRLQTTQVKWTENGCEIGTTIISYYEHFPETNEIEVQVHSELVKKILELTHSEHFSFLKNFLYKLNNAQAIKLFPYFISWRNKGMVEITVEAFKKRFGCETTGYNKFSNLKTYVLDPAIMEINDKTDLQISYKILGTNLKSVKPRITGLQFFIKEKAKQKQLTQAIAENTTYEEIETTPLKPTPTTVKAPKPTESQAENPYLADILRVFHLFEPDSSPENIGVFLTYFDNQKAVLEACLYAEQEKIKGRVINNFRGYLVAGIPKGLGAGILEERAKEQAKAQQVEQKKTAQADKTTELENLLKDAEILRGGYRTEMDTLLKNTPTSHKENVAAIIRTKKFVHAHRTLEEFESKICIAVFIETFIAVYPERFGEVYNKYQKEFDRLAAKIKKLDPTKAKNLFHY